MIVLLSSIAMSQAAPALAAEAEMEAPAIVVTGTHAVYDADAVSATRTATPLIDTPQSISVLDRAQLDDQAFQQLNDALRYVPGVTLAQGEGHRDQIVLRGQSSTADFYLDGVRDDAQYYRPLYNTERVEVLKGANALLFGRGGGGGVVNRVSKVALLGIVRRTGAAGLDSFGAWSLAADLNQPLGAKAAVRLNATHEALANHRDRFGGHVVALAPTATARLGPATRLTAAYEYVDDRRVTDRGVPAVAGAPITGFDRTFFGDPAVNRSTVSAHVARLRLDHELADGLTFDATAQFAQYHKYYGNVLPGVVNAARTTVALSGYRSTTTRTNWTGQANLVWKGATGPIGHTLLAGFEASDQDTATSRDDARLGGLASTVVPLAQQIAVPTVSWVPLSASQTRVRSLSAYVQDQVEIGAHLQLIAGARYDDFRITATNLFGGAVTGRRDGKWSPRLGAIVKPVANLSLYASYARSFLPQSGDQFTTLAANLQTLAPEEFRNLEIGAKWNIRPALALTVAAFQIDRTNTRATDPVTGNPVLTGSSRVKGYEAALAGQLLPGWNVTLGYARQDGQIRTTTTAAPAGRQLDKLPHHQLTAWSRYDVTRAVGFGLGLVRQSSQFASISNAVRLPGFTRIDAAVYLDLGKALALQINVQNLADARFFPSTHNDTNIAVADPRNLRLTARLKF